jgi:hypothetical protein
MQKLGEKLKQLAVKNPDGFTVKLPTLEPVKSGWVVAMKETQYCFNDAGLQKALEVAIKTSNVIGGWKEGKRWYWDASWIYEDEKEATQAAIENEQIAIFHLDTAYLKFI